MIVTPIKIAEGYQRLTGEGAFQVLARARELEAQGRSIVHLQVGEPDFDTPEHVKDAGIAAIKANKTRYTASAGIPELRDAIAQYAGPRRGMAPFERDEIVVSPGLKPMIWNALSMLLDPGDEMVYADPAYPSYASAASYLQAKLVPVPLLERTGFRLDLDELASKMSSRTKVLVLNSPHNPTGGVLTRGDLETIAELALRYDVTVVSDEIYNRHIYDAEFFSIAALDGMRERTIILDGFSKAYSMTGWRLGYGIMPKHVARAVSMMGQNTYSCTAYFTQLAGVAALTGPDDSVVAMVNEFRRRRDVIVAGLKAIPGVTCATPQGAFYVFPNFSAVTSDDKALSSFFLEEAGVACVQGTSFGDAGEGYIRLSYATSLENINEGLRRIREALPRFKA